jgi:CubicO group peptidase (beta-lactamase class C family)
VSATRSAEIQALENYAFLLSGTDSQRQGLRTDSLLIIRDGQIYYERYARGFDETKPHIAWSVTKAVTNALTGIAVQLGVVTLNDPINRFVPVANPDVRVGNMTLKNLLEFSSGLSWNESYENPSVTVQNLANGKYQKISVLSMLYGAGNQNLVKFVTDHALRDPPGTSWYYSTGDLALLASVVAAAMTPTYGEDFAHDLLFGPLGMTKAAFERDRVKNPLGGSQLYDTPQDLARFGFFILNDGCWEGQRILPDNWVLDSSTASQVFLTGKIVDPLPADGTWDLKPTGYALWLNQLAPAQGLTQLPWPNAPADTVVMYGHWGQFVIVIPSLDLVIVRTADDRDERNVRIDVDKLISLSIAVTQ